MPDSPAVQYFAGWELLQQGRLDEAEAALRRRIELEEVATAGPHVYLARVHAARGEREEATGQYAVALALDARFAGLVAEFEGYIRGRELDGFAAVDALIADYDVFLATNPDDRRFQCLARNNLAFLLREVAASFTSRGAARIHTFPEGVPDDARRIAAACLRIYEEAVALIPEDVENQEFRERWIYAGVLNDTALILHYFAELQDLERAERLYLRAFDLTDGAYMDAYFYNLQFLYGFELEDREERWFELAEIAMDAILKEDPESETGFSPDPIKRRAARRDYERLASALGR
jgi:tetratricopeptide (TPR) repeat protein